jgi:hypothetical protein
VRIAHNSGVAAGDAAALVWEVSGDVAQSRIPPNPQYAKTLTRILVRLIPKSAQKSNFLASKNKTGQLAPTKCMHKAVGGFDP